jgi:hypothetical protein
MDVISWLLDNDPAVRWQAMRDLTDAPEDQIAAERARVATEGWGARLLALQEPHGQWPVLTKPAFGSKEAEQWWQTLGPARQGTLFPAGTSTTWSLALLKAFGLDPASPAARHAVGLVRDHVQWEHDAEPFFAGEVEPCINGRTVALGAYFGVDVAPVVERLLGEQMEDGGWNCDQENGSVRTRASCASPSTTVRASRAGGTRSALCACSPGTSSRRAGAWRGPADYSECALSNCV